MSSSFMSLFHGWCPSVSFCKQSLKCRSPLIRVLGHSLVALSPHPRLEHFPPRQISFATPMGPAAPPPTSEDLQPPESRPPTVPPLTLVPHLPPEQGPMTRRESGVPRCSLWGPSQGRRSSRHHHWRQRERGIMLSQLCSKGSANDVWAQGSAKPKVRG